MTGFGQPTLLDWRDGIHYRRPAPCVLCGNPTPLRSHAGEAAHKVCAEDWNLAHPGESRLALFTRPDSTCTPLREVLDQRLFDCCQSSPVPATVFSVNAISKSRRAHLRGQPSSIHACGNGNLHGNRVNLFRGDLG
jgi:hypothetical protein